MKNSKLGWAIILVVLIALGSCRSSNNASFTTTNNFKDNEVNKTETTSTSNLPSTQNRLILSVPDISHKTVGETFEVVLKGEFIDPFYQISGRLLFDSTCIQPVSGQKGNWFKDGDIEYFNLTQKDFLPFALTPKYQTSKARTGQGILAKFKFRILNPTKDASVQINNDLTYLQVRNDEQQRLPVTLEREVTK